MTRLLGPLAAALLAAAPLRAAGNAPIVVHIYHTNDVHGWIMARPDRRRDGRLQGGAPALAAFIARDHGPKLVLDAGDWWQGTPEGSLSKGRAVAEIFNAIGYDAAEIGNHDFDAGEASLRRLIPRFKMPVLAANIYGPDGKRVPWAVPHLIKTVAGVKFGIFGLLTTRMPQLEFPKNIAGLSFRREVDEARDQVAVLRREGATVVIAVTHVGFERAGQPPFEGDQTLAREAPGIDLIVGGHSHTVLSRPWRDPENGTLVVQAGSYLKWVGRATLTIDPRTGRVLSSEDRLFPIRPDRMGEDPAVKAIVDRRLKETGAVFDVVVATASAELPRGGDESALGDWMADCYRSWSGADAAIQNAGGIRDKLPAGPVTVRELFDVMPFDNELVSLRLSGARLREVLSHGAGLARPAQLSGAALLWRRGPTGGGELVSASVDGRPLDDAASYTVETLDFLASGGDGFDFGGAAETSSGAKARDVLLACARRQGRLVPPPSGRLKEE